MAKDKTAPAKVAILLIKGYRKFLSPLLGKNCRFHPSCSRYAIEAIERFGFFKGCRLAARRILKCHPFNEGGFDPVPGSEKEK
ncbi:membrane protein insertion efficiency factor YidD [Thalassotalea agarivorans]|uniref:Putative membrane protein insertion efficiency factor n=1 Tax=Thalassotalea agarivorans TaxID=349064 RepID=A0A1I0GF12_THASX|nr:membrane protein insertion efficiency factor YidD [Thalassotalea agarivorans]SET68594.1 hypothetical protein SAMN05660429_02406 [Thalassotalea agarivorans]